MKPPQTLDSLHLYRQSLASLSLPIPADNSPLSLPLPPSLPPSKLIPNTRFLVDAFRFSTASSASYFLTHFHSDHYTGLSSNWSQGIIFCSPVTAHLLIQILKVPAQFVFTLPLRQPVTIDGSEVTLVDANHCPGAVQFLFKVPGKDSAGLSMYVHTGDFRYCGSMSEDGVLREFVGCDAVFLDTTYCNPKFVFPCQEESIDYIVGVIDKLGGQGLGQKKILFLVATYVVGKERILLEIAERCGRKIHVDRRKMEVLRVLGHDDSGVFTEDASESDVHVVGWNVLGETWPYFRPNFVKMKDIMEERGYSRVVGFVPTGWTYEVKRNKFSVRSKESSEIHLVPYSEHSNFDELREYVKFLRPKRVIPTVGVDTDKLDSKHVIKMQKHFATLVDEMANKKDFLMAFRRVSPEKIEKVELEAVSELKDLDQEKIVKPSGVKTLELYSSQNLTILKDEDTEKFIQELCESLPPWVTRDQMLHLISSSKNNLVDAVSYFYDHETEFHQQILASEACVSSSPQTALFSESEPPIKSFSPISSQEIVDTPLTQNYRSLATNPATRSGTTEKRKKNAVNKLGKKVKTISKLESGGAKQSTITRYFGKAVPEVSKCNQHGVVNEKPSDETSFLSEDTKPYREELNQFIQLTGGDESSRSYAAAILEKTKGDINKALDMHFGNPEGYFDESAERSVASSDLVPPEYPTNESSSVLDKTFPEEKEHSVAPSPQESLIKNVVPTAVALPTDEYDPIQHACWRAGEHAPYIHLARTFDLVEAEKGKIKATSMLCNMFRSLLALSPEDVLPAVYLCTNKIAPDHENIELNIGGSLVTSALEEACGTKRSKIKNMYNCLGDLGDVAQACRQTQTLLAPPPPLLIKDVFSVLRKISVQTGSGSTARKKSLILNLMRSCREKEIKFIVRTLVRNLRIGAMIRTVLPALAQAVAWNSLVSADEKKAEISRDKLQYLSAAIVEAYNILPDLGLVVPTLISEGLGFSSSALSMVPGVPIKPMLAKITNGVVQALKLFHDKPFTCEYKYDGQRAQIHKLSNGNIRVFSRNGDETTSKFPDLIKIVEESCKPEANSFIVDAEVVAVDRKNGCKLMSFQELSSRERGSKDSSVMVNNIKVEICVFIFDIMFANGEQLLELPLRQRRKYLKDMFGDERKGYFEYAKELTVEAHNSCSTNEVSAQINSFLEEAFNASCEGIMFKLLDVDAEYSPSKRTDTWLKVKRDYVEELNDSLDLVPIGAWHGNGRKAGWYSPFLMACYNPEAEEFQSVCRVMSGFSDAFYSEMKEFFSGDRILSKKPPYYRTGEVPDVWFSPQVVWEIRGADFTVSPVHQAAVGLVHPTRGISIRFPRFIHSVGDRDAEDCSTAADVADMFNSQTRKMDLTPAN